MPRWVAWMVLVGVWSGCGGGYVLIAPDALAPVGSQVQTVVRLQRKELPGVTPPVRAAPLRFQLADGPLRAARTDKKGYASAALPTPNTAGVYPLTVALQDIEGREADWELRAFVWDPAQAVIVVDLDALPLAGLAYILYLSAQPVSRFPALHAALEAAGLPDGPILSWREKDWWERGWRAKGWWEKGWWSKTIVSPLGELRKTFPGLRVGIAGSETSVRAFESAGLKCLFVGSTERTILGAWGGKGGKGQAARRIGSAELTVEVSWAKLAAEGLEGG